MTLRAALAQRPRRLSVGLAVAVCLAAGAAVYAIVAAGTGGASTRAATISTESPAAFRAALEVRLHDESLNYHWVVCVRTPHRFDDVSVVRCNVDFGEPHIQAFCSVLRGGRLLTNAQDAAIPCGHDNAGYTQSVVQYG
jgi:hypothetical protein